MGSQAEESNSTLGGLGPQGEAMVEYSPNDKGIDSATESATSIYHCMPDQPPGGFWWLLQTLY
jgi:hypothetical protein